MTDFTPSLPVLVKDAEARLEENERHLGRLRNTLLGKGWVVTMPGGIYVAIDTEPDEEQPGRRRIVGHSITYSPGQASHMTREDADNVASACRNGHGDCGVVIHITEALERAIANDRDILLALEDVSMGPGEGQ